jgi:hypothetical protein
MPTPSIQVIKDCLFVQSSKNVYYIKKDCILGFGSGTTFREAYLEIYTNIPNAKILIEAGSENEIKELTKMVEIIKNILSPEVPEVVKPSGNMLRN